ncbi:P-loop containing nucleoside triphosphate hydrolase protein [Tilletiaria anomala UBC 951]|uniref:p-loop containing nucleoside triphosphate hydrolase protein n=1 Tax=Tilletiaria anomala (strain ATCC 24038 / CBS 436.72 / UBC 951) TaxID=1037660 RepID=A0A066WNH5_TILAU|nr:P-loop containing nucleoside triphosphate hydrolase protein [Tilletiaria anomala UBC 951]KDN52554.1 P-loop containing nucleoside triphosphate hydrolase protein [Tilletiaria anomala UBC 951]
MADVERAFFRVEGLSGPQWASWSGMTFDLARGDILLLRGESGSGKTTLLKALADLLPSDGGSIVLQGRPHASLPPHIYRSRVLYVPQRPSILPGSPRDFLDMVYDFSANRDLGPLPEVEDLSERDTEAAVTADGASLNAHGWKIEEAEIPLESTSTADDASSIRSGSSARNNSRDRPTVDTRSLRRAASKSFSRAPTIPNDPIFLSSAEWGLPTSVWDREWSQISGGEAQRVGLAVPLCLIGGKRKGDGVLLLDEPTSALDSRTAAAVEKTLLLSRTALTLIWITHSEDQARRIITLVDEDNHRRRGSPAKYDDDLPRERKVFVLSLSASSLQN